MTAMHLKTDAHAPEDIALVEALIRGVDGINGIVSIVDIGLVSVLYDERLADDVDIVEAARLAGFAAVPVARS